VMHVEGDPLVAAEWIRARLQGATQGAVLIKASRGMRLERVVERLLQDA
jgi:UDP-N-acetylmuramyl pentapeptide synthase